jgi:hypothetical protein
MCLFHWGRIGCRKSGLLMHRVVLNFSMNLVPLAFPGRAGFLKVWGKVDSFIGFWNFLVDLLNLFLLDLYAPA